MPDAAPHRVGRPSPLMLHLTAALAGYQQALMAAPRVDAPQFPWDPRLADAAAALGSDLDQVKIAAEIGRRLSAMVRGIELWQGHPYRRRVAEPPVLWQDGCSRVIDYGACPEATAPEGAPVLVIPSLINRAYILDLMPERCSLLRWLAARGLRPLLLDWGVPGPQEAGFGLEDYGQRRLLPALDRIAAETRRPVAVLGYCMGGTLAAGLAARRGPGLSALATIGAPWDFGSTAGISGGLRAMVRAEGTARSEDVLAALGDAFGMVPVELFQLLFALINPMQAAVKFQRFERLDQDGPAARLFVALEDWLADGVPMPAPAARDLLIGWQLENGPARGRWRFLGGPVSAAAIDLPVLAFCGGGDSIAPPPLADPLPEAIAGARRVRPGTGHVGMVVGSNARAQVWRPLAEFLATHAG
jgi:polyhydroxyalkanoate synthase subunit PhaC